MDESKDQVIKSVKPPYKKWLIFFAAIILLLLIFIGASGSYAFYEIYVPVNKNNTESIEFVVEKGQGVKEIAAQLQQADLIHSAFWFEVYVWYKKQGAALQAGKYSLSQDLSVPLIVEMITGGKILSNEVKLTFPEGFTAQQIQQRLAEGGVGAGAMLDTERIENYQLQYKLLGNAPAAASLEGFLFPDTYIFQKDMKSEQIIKKFLDNFDKKLTPDLRESISRQGKNIYEIVILASIIQQEAINEEEMPLISGVFTNRLRIGMALQSDATVNYITGKQLRQPTLDDTKVQSLYNTYLHVGLPPGPICNPGLAAIRAAIFPQSTDYLYFLHPLDAPTVFSKTLEEHNKNKAKWLK